MVNKLSPTSQCGTCYQTLTLSVHALTAPPSLSLLIPTDIHLLTITSDGRYQQFRVRYDIDFSPKYRYIDIFRYFKINIDILVKNRYRIELEIADIAHH